MLFDTHAHYNDAKFSGILDDLLSKMPENNVGYIVNVCCITPEIPDMMKLCEKYPFMYAAIGVHPQDVGDMTEKDIEILKEYSKEKKVLAIGEIGLDYYYENAPRDVQKYWFARQVELAKELNLPVIIHDRDAHLDTMNILKETKVSECGGVFHCYSGSVEMAKEILDMGMYIAFGGSVTFKNARRPVEAAQYVPLDRILIETDCPYLAPDPFRGKLNSSLYIYRVVEKIAELKGLTVEEVEKATTENAKRLFKLD